MINTLQDIKDKLALISLSNNWLVWCHDNLTIFSPPNLIERNISVASILKLIVFYLRRLLRIDKIFILLPIQ